MNRNLVAVDQACLLPGVRRPGTPIETTRFGRRESGPGRDPLFACRPRLPADLTLSRASPPACDTRRGYEEDAYRRLQAVREQVDPEGLFMANHPIPVAG